MTTNPARSDAAIDTELGSPASSASPAADRAADRAADLAARLDAVERTVTDSDADFSLLEDLATIERRVVELESAVESFTDHLDEIGATTRVVRGYPGGVRTVNEDVERRTNATLAKAESLESELVDGTVSPAPSRSVSTPALEVTSHARRATDGDDGNDSQRAAETGLGTGTTAPSPESRTVPDSGTPTGSHGDSVDRGLAARLRDAL